MTVRFYSFK